MQFGQLQSEQFIFPRSVLTDFVVCEDQRSALNVGEMRHRHDRNFCHAQFSSCEYASVTGHDVILSINDHRCTPAELANARRDLRNLGV